MSSSFWDSWFKEEPNDSCLPSLSRKQRVVGFLTLLFAGGACFGLSFLLLPILVLRVRKFVALFTLGSVLTLGSFSLLWGPVSHMKHLFSPQRLPFTAAYLSSMALTLYSALVRRSTILTLLFAICEVAALLWYTVSYIPGGVTGLKFLSKLCGKVTSKSVEKGLSGVV
ncbi:uncharacterized protein LOC134182294 [Corticium candelabrum]|uniref:uncharacterized protein LOC134182294 n=1 Tax=Corticium candelabrum TaxID=121492 RepID=UPI002E27225F|nr:uncharacterized protein LOC134182294 [Corticium candelabrum]